MTSSCENFPSVVTFDTKADLFTLRSLRCSRLCNKYEREREGERESDKEHCASDLAFSLFLVFAYARVSLFGFLTLSVFLFSMFFVNPNHPHKPRSQLAEKTQRRMRGNHIASGHTCLMYDVRPDAIWTPSMRICPKLDRKTHARFFFEKVKNAKKLKS